MISHSSDLASEYLKGSCYWRQVTQKYHIVSLLSAHCTHWIWRSVHNMNRAYGPSHWILTLTFFCLSLVYFIWRRRFYPLFSSIALWALNPSCGNGGFCCISQFITHGKLWSGTPSIIPLYSFHSCARGSENRWRYSTRLLERSVDF